MRVYGGEGEEGVEELLVGDLEQLPNQLVYVDLLVAHPRMLLKRRS